MTRAGASSTQPTRRAAAATLLSAVLLGILAARPLISESFVRVDIAILDPATAELGPTPAATAALDTLVLGLCAAIVLLARPAIAPGPLAAVGLLGLGVTVSTLVADDPRSALNAGANLLTLAVAGLTLVGTTRAGPTTGANASGSLRAVAAALLIAGQMTASLRCYQQVYVDGPQTLQMFREHKQREAQRGVDVETAQWTNYERRLLSANAFGYVAHPNVQAAALMSGTLLAAGLLAGAWAARRAIGPAPLLCAAALCFGPLAALPLTGSRGALSALGIGAGLGLAAIALRRVVGRHPRRVLGLLVSIYSGGFLGLLAFGALRGGLPGESLDFRWQYWTAAASAWQEAPLTGLGRENFADAYLRHKVPAATEEVRDPHNLWVTLLVELGPCGLAGGAWLLLLAGRRVIAALGAAAAVDAPADGGAAAARAPSLAPADRRCAAVALLAALLAQAWFSGTPFFASGVGLLWLVETAAVLALCFVAALAVIATLSREQRGQYCIAAGVAAALAALLLHVLVEITLSTPSGASLLVLLVVAGASAPAGGTGVLPARVRGQPVPAGSMATRPDALQPNPGCTPGLLLAALAAGHLLFCTLPTSIEQRRLSEVSRWRGQSLSAEVLLARIAALAGAPMQDRLSCALRQRLGETAVSLAQGTGSQSALRVAQGLAIEVAVLRPRQLGAQRLLADCWEVWAFQARRRSDTAAECTALVETERALRAAIRCYPSEPRLRIRSARVVVRLGELCPERTEAARGLEDIRVALEIDAARKSDVAVKLTPAEVAEARALEQRLREKP